MTRNKGHTLFEVIHLPISLVLTIIGLIIFFIVVLNINNKMGSNQPKNDQLNQLRVFKSKHELFYMNHRDFEYFAAAFLQLTRDLKTHVTNATKDGGKDIIAFDGDEPIYVEVKHWKSNVGRPAIQKLEGAMSGDRIKRGYFITSSGFTRDAIEYAAKTNITLIDGNELIRQMHT